MNAGAGNLRHTLAELEAMATIRPVEVSGGQKRRMGCPFHGSDKQRSLQVNLETGHFGCYGCGAWGYLSDHPGRDRRRPGRGPGNKNPRPGSGDGLRTRQEVHAALQEATPLLHQDPPVAPSARPGQAQKLARNMEAAQRHLEDAAALAYLEARHTSLELAKAHGLGYFPPGKRPGRRAAARWGRLAFPLETPAGEMVGVYSRAVDPQYPQEKAPSEVRHDVWGRRGLFNAAALAGPSLYLNEACFDALSMLAGGYPTSAALVGTKGLPWAALGNVRELYLCLDRDANWEGQKAARELARLAVLHGLRGYTMGAGAYGGYPEPSEQWEREGRVTLRVCGDCDIPVHPPTADRCPTCGAPMCPGCTRCDPSCPIMGGDLWPERTGEKGDKGFRGVGLKAGAQIQADASNASAINQPSAEDPAAVPVESPLPARDGKGTMADNEQMEPLKPYVWDSAVAGPCTCPDTSSPSAPLSLFLAGHHCPVCAGQIWCHACGGCRDCG